MSATKIWKTVIKGLVNKNLETRHPEPGFSRVKDLARGGRRSGGPYTTVDLTPGVALCPLSASRQRRVLPSRPVRKGGPFTDY
jgi:hypothetical protein